MALSTGEKIIIAMLADIHKHLGVEGDVDVDKIIPAITGGHEWSLKWEHGWLLNDETHSEEVVDQTADILTMWRFIETGYAQLEDGEKAEVVEANHGAEPRFEGFDGNNEPHHSVARHMVSVLGRFSELEGRSLNSHYQSVPGYLRQLNIFNEVIGTEGRYAGTPLDKEELIRILRA